MHEYRAAQIKQWSAGQATATGTLELRQSPSADHSRMTNPNYHYNHICTRAEQRDE